VSGSSALPPGDDVLSVRDGRLFVEDVSACDLALAYGTPLYVLSERQLRINFARWASAADGAWPNGPTLVMPSLKANTSPVLRAILNEEGAGCDVFGPGELEIALHSHVPAERISLNGATKSDALLHRAISAGVAVTLDSAGEFERARQIAKSLHQVARVRFRIRPWLPRTNAVSDFDPAGGAAYLAVQDYRAGMPGDDVAECLTAAVNDGHVHPAGIHAHAGRQTTNLSFWEAYARDVGATCAALARLCPQWRPEEIDLGGGFAVPRDPTGRPYPSGGAMAPTPAEYMAALTAGLSEGLATGGLSPDGITLHVEPGRAVYGNAGLHLTRVLNLKQQKRPLPRTWVETDTSEAFLGDTIIERNSWTIVLADEPARPERIHAAVTGISCGFDVLVPAKAQPRVVPGEILAILDTGAYQDATASNFNAMARPASVLVSGGTVSLIKRRETLDDITARDVPAKLTSEDPQAAYARRPGRGGCDGDRGNTATGWAPGPGGES
jgi:diaminopimelate decarboxylase